VDPAYLAVHVEEDCLHWYFRGRLAVNRSALRRVLPRCSLRLLETGCGTGNMLGALGAFGEAAAGYRVERLSYFNTVRFPAPPSIRLYKRLRRDDRHDLGRPGPRLNAVLERLFALERHVVPRLALPFGTSLFVAARRA